MDATAAAQTLAKRLQEDEAFRNELLGNPIAAMEGLGMDRDLAWEMLASASVAGGAGADVAADAPARGYLGVDCSGWLTKAGCQCTGFKSVCAARTIYFSMECTTHKCG